MGERRRYRMRKDHVVIAVPLDLDTPGFTYRKWGAEQRCKAGDWVVDNAGDVYTVDKETFSRTYVYVDRGRWWKRTPVWAEVAEQAGSVETKEGTTHYAARDYVVSNDEDGSDVYAVPRAKFESMYELDA